MLGTRIGTLALTCASINDIIAWCLLALVVAVANGKGVPGIMFTVGLTILYIGVMLAVVRPTLVWAARHIRSTHGLVVFALVLLLLSAYFTNAIGIHPVFGAFFLGIMLPRRTVYIDYIRSMDRLNIVLFLPIFFVYSGLRTQIGRIDTSSLWLTCLLIVTLACAGKFVGASLPIRWMGESRRAALSLGVLMNTRGLVELILLNIGLDMGVLSPTFFSMLVIMALVTTMMASPLLFLLGYHSHDHQSTVESVYLESSEDQIVPQGEI